MITVGIRSCLLGLALSLACISTAQAQVQERNCWMEAARRYHVNAQLLYAIARHESGMNPQARGSNANGSYDIGLMQINSSHLPLLGQYGIQEQHLYDPCVSIHVGAWILAGNIRRMGNNWIAIGAYNAASHEKRVHYAWKIFRQLEAVKHKPLNQVHIEKQ